ncbi:MAG: cell division protein ZapA [Pseudomonadota bacterium]
MAEVTLSIGGHTYLVSCRDGEEPHLNKIASIVDAKVTEARSAVGDLGEIRQLLLASLLLADELLEAAKAAPPAPVAESGVETAAIEALAERVEAIAAKLEKTHQPAYM